MSLLKLKLTTLTIIIYSSMITMIMPQTTFVFFLFLVILFEFYVIGVGEIL